MTRVNITKSLNSTFLRFSNCSYMHANDNEAMIDVFTETFNIANNTNYQIGMRMWLAKLRISVIKFNLFFNHVHWIRFNHRLPLCSFPYDKARARYQLTQQPPWLVLLQRIKYSRNHRWRQRQITVIVDDKTIERWMPVFRVMEMECPYTRFENSKYAMTCCVSKCSPHAWRLHDCSLRRGSLLA